MRQADLDLARRVAMLEAKVYGLPAPEPRQITRPKQVGAGAHRDVYLVRPGVVAKHARNDRGKAANALEWDRWQAREELGIADWICPCISYDGAVLEMAQGVPVDTVPDHPEHVRALKDTGKAQQWVEYQGRVVLCDYGHNRGKPMYATKPKKASKKR